MMKPEVGNIMFCREYKFYLKKGCSQETLNVYYLNFVPSGLNIRHDSRAYNSPSLKSRVFSYKNKQWNHNDSIILKKYETSYLVKPEATQAEVLS